MITRSSPSMYRKHKITASLINMLLRCSVGRTKHNSMEHAFLFISRPSFRHYLKVINIIFVPVTFFSPQASDPDVWGRSQAQALNMNHYANKKSAAESMLDVALLMANASQLKAVLEQGPDFSFYTPIVTLISISLCLQVTVGVLLIFIGKKINRAQAFWVNPEVSKLSSKPHNLQMSFCVLYPQHNSPMSSPLTNSPIASYWTLAVTTATSPDTRSKFTRF